MARRVRQRWTGRDREAKRLTEMDRERQRGKETETERDRGQTKSGKETDREGWTE